MNVLVSDATLRPHQRRNIATAPLALPRQPLRVRLYVLMALLDLAGLVGGVAIVGTARFGDALASEAVTVGAMLIPLFFGLALTRGAYGADALCSWRRGLPTLMLALVGAAAAIVFIGFCLKAADSLSRIAVCASVIVAAFLIIGLRALGAIYAKHVLNGYPLSRVLICDGVDCARPHDVQSVDAAALGIRPDVSDPLMLDRLGRLLRHADSVIVACPPERRTAWAMALKGLDTEGELVMPEIAAVGGIGTARFGAEATVVVSSGILGLRQRAAKRLLDLSIALAALVVLAPLLVIAAIAIRLETRGGVLFVQQRLGRGNRLFSMYKFRSMRADMCDAEGARSTGRDDDRITRVGRIIRATSIDELPQLINILKGDMSFVGPRPHALGSLAGDALFWEVDERYWHRHTTKPGLTGLAQVRGFRGATHQRSDLVNRLQADLEYQQGWTIWRDISILISTLRVVIHKNAY